MALVDTRRPGGMYLNSPGYKEKETTNKTKWTQEEDQMLKDAVKLYGTASWYMISTKIPHRNGKQCRERWLGQLNPDIQRKEWTVDDDYLLLQLQKAYGNKWTYIAKFLPGRSVINIKNRWYYLLRHGLPHAVLSSHIPPMFMTPPSPKQPTKRLLPIEFDEEAVFGVAFQQFSQNLLG